MGVKLCSRKSCDNIMCDTYVQGTGYVCGECQSDFKVFLERKDKDDLTVGEIKRELDEFMCTEKECAEDSEKMDVDEFFNQQSY